MIHTQRRRLFILLGTVIAQLGLGTIYTWSLFNQPLVNIFGWELNRVALTFSITSSALAFGSLFSERLQKKFGIRAVVSISGITMGLGLILASRANSLMMLYVSAGIIVGAADGIGYMISLTNCIKWFPEKKGLISGISIGAYGTGSLIFKYVNSSFIGSVGVSRAMLYWGSIVAILVIAGAQLLKDATVQSDDNPAASMESNFTSREMLRTKEAYLIFIAFFTASMSGLYIIGVVKDIGVQLVGIDAHTAANAVAMVAIFNTAGRIILGALSDRIGRLRVVLFNFIVTAAAIFTMSFMDLSPATFFAAIGGIAFCYGGNVTIFPAIVGDFFGMIYHSKNYGIIYQGFGLGALSGSFIAAALGGFKPTFMVIGILCIISIIISANISVPRNKSNYLKDIHFSGKTA